MQVRAPRARVRRPPVPRGHRQGWRLRPHGQYRRAVRVVRARLDALDERPAGADPLRLPREVLGEGRPRVRAHHRCHRGGGLRPAVGGAAARQLHPHRVDDGRRPLPPHVPQGQARGAHRAVRASRRVHRRHAPLGRAGQEEQEGQEGVSETAAAARRLTTDAHLFSPILYATRRRQSLSLRIAHYRYVRVPITRASNLHTLARL